MPNHTLQSAKNTKNDEFYTQYYDIEREVESYLDYNPDVFRDKTVLLPCDDPEWSNFTRYFAQNFERLGLKKLISTSYAVERKQELYNVQLSLFETEFETNSPQYDAKKTRTHGKIFILDRDENGDQRIDIDDLKWNYLIGDGDFRSKEVTKLRDEADVIVTNPPFSLFRDFLAWIVSVEKSFLIIGNMNAITYKEVFPLIKDNYIWLGVSSGTKEYLKPEGGVQKMGNTCWFTNIDHGRRHRTLELMTMEDNLKYSRHKEVRGRKEYVHYANYDAIDVPFVDAIPSDYKGVMGVPKSFLEKYSPEQFDIIGCAEGDSGKELGLLPYPRHLKRLNPSLRDGQVYYMEGGTPKKPYARILIRKKQ
jgi:hypothetical protein